LIFGVGRGGTMFFFGFLVYRYIKWLKEPEISGEGFFVYDV
jgi:hypothetical protein